MIPAAGTAAAVTDHRRRLVRFLATYLLLCGSLFFLVNRISGKNIAFFNCLHAEILGRVFALLGRHPLISGSCVVVDGFGVNIVAECSTVFVSVLFVSFVIAYPASVLHKTTGVLVGVPVLFAVNLLRLTAIMMTGIYHYSFWPYVHLYSGQLLMMAFVLTLSLLWLRWVVRVQALDPPIVFLFRVIVFSAIPFVLWLLLNQPYVTATFHAVRWLLALFGYAVSVPTPVRLYPHAYSSFNLVLFSSLMLAATSISVKEKTCKTALGLVALMTADIWFRICQVLYLDVKLDAARGPFIGLLILTQWLLPFVLWIVFLRRTLFAAAIRPLNQP